MLEDAGLENFPQLFAEAVVSGSLPLDSLYATKLSDSAMNINRPKAEGYRYSHVYKLVYALASSRPRCGAALVCTSFATPCILPTRHTRSSMQPQQQKQKQQPQPQQQPQPGKQVLKAQNVALVS